MPHTSENDNRAHVAAGLSFRYSMPTPPRIGDVIRDTKPVTLLDLPTSNSNTPCVHGVPSDSFVTFSYTV